VKREPFPLQWPEGWQRTKPSSRERSRFGFRSTGQVSFSSARHDLLAELDRLGAGNVVITSDLPTRHDGLPYANGRADDPGIAVWFVLANRKLGRTEERVFACDKWRTHAENMQAIAKSIEAMRGLERWGAGDVVQRAFAGFAALPAGSGEETIATPPPRKRTWREVFEMFNVYDAIPAADILAIARVRHRNAIKAAHPDVGGTHELAAELNAALAEAERELGGGS
jgi:hypothetical protein